VPVGTRLVSEVHNRGRETARLPTGARSRPLEALAVGSFQSALVEGFAAALASPSTDYLRLSA
jgi:hypothetical protein